MAGRLGLQSLNLYYGITVALGVKVFAAEQLFIETVERCDGFGVLIVGKLHFYFCTLKLWTPCW